MKHSKYTISDIISIFFAIGILSTLPLVVIILFLGASETGDALDNKKIIKETVKETIDAEEIPETSYYNYCARFIAGLPQIKNNDIKKNENLRIWKQYSASVNRKWKRLNNNKIKKIRDFSEKNLGYPNKYKTIFYPFSGPDFLHAFTLFPSAERYIMVALEKPGAIPSLYTLSRDSLLYNYIGKLNRSLRDILQLSFFITKNMRVDLRSGQIDGVLPVILFFLARTGNTVINISDAKINDSGEITLQSGQNLKISSKGMNITFFTADSVKKEIIYFSRNINNPNLEKDMAFKKFVKINAPFASYLKAASYLMHSRYFSGIRRLILDNSGVLLQDDSGIPVRYFKDGRWQLKFFGVYNGPIPLFAGNFQQDLYDYYHSHSPAKLNFGIGYKHRKGSSNLMLALKR